LDRYREALGERLVAAYALGSLAHGGFSPLVSDVDLALVLADPLEEADAAAIAAVADAVRAQGGDLHTRLSVVWGTPATLGGRSAGGRFPPADRLDLLDHGRLLWGAEARQGIPRPARAEVMLEGARFALGYLGGDEVLQEIRQPERMLAGGVRHATRLVLVPVRLLYTARTGMLGSNDDAAAHYLSEPEAPAAALVAAALGWRKAPSGVDEEAALALLRDGLRPLYLGLMHDQEARLTTVDPELAEAFRDWRAQLVSADGPPRSGSERARASTRRSRRGRRGRRDRR
jgi:hypothetical protein